MIVEAPSNLLFENIFFIFLIIARVILFASTPGCEKKFLSSADKKKLIKFLEDYAGSAKHEIIPVPVNPSQKNKLKAASSSK